MSKRLRSHAYIDCLQKLRGHLLFEHFLQKVSRFIKTVLHSLHINQVLRSE